MPLRQNMSHTAGFPWQNSNSLSFCNSTSVSFLKLKANDLLARFGILGFHVTSVRGIH